MRGVRTRTSRFRQADTGRSLDSRARRFGRLRSVKATQKIAQAPLTPGAASELSHLVWLYGPQLRQALEPFALTPGGALCLQRVAQSCDTPTLLSQTLRLTPGRIAPLLSELELRGLVICQRELGDKEFTYLYLTEAGRRLSGQVQEAITTRLQGLEAGECQRSTTLARQPSVRKSSHKAVARGAASDQRVTPVALIPYIDSAGRLLRYPVQLEVKRLALAYLAEKFDLGRSYGGGEVHALLGRHHTFGSAALLQRELFEEGLLALNGDGSVWWRV